MADVSIDATVSTATARVLRSVVFTTQAIGYWFYIDSTGGFAVIKTTDGGATWAVGGTIGGISSNTTDVAADVWFDKWTPGDTGTKIHFCWFDVTADDIVYLSLDTNGDTYSNGGVPLVAFAGASAVAGRGAFCSITKTRSGYLYIAFDIDAGAEHGLVRSTDGGGTWSANLSTLFVDSTIDQCLCFPATGSGDNNDMVAIYHDASADLLQVRCWDSSAAAIVNLSGAGVVAMIENTTDLTGQMGFSAAVRNSDGHIIVVACTDRDTATADILVREVIPDLNVAHGLDSPPGSPVDITTNIDDIYNPAVFIDQNTNNIYVAYNGKRDGSEVLGTTTKIYYTKSTDGGTTWTSGDTAYQEGATAAAFQVWAPISGNRFYVGWRVGTTLVGNKVNSLDLTPATGVNRTTTDTATFSDSVARAVVLGRSVADSAASADVATRTGTFSRSISDASQFTEAAVRLIVKPRSASDSFNSADIATRIGTFLRSVSEAPNFADVATRVAIALRNTTDAETFGDVASRVISKLRSTSDAATFGDVALRTLTIFRVTSDSATSADAASRAFSGARSVSDSSTFGNVATRIGTFLRTISDSSTYVDVATQVKSGANNVARSAVDAFTESDVATRTVTLLRSISDAFSNSNVATRLVSVSRTVSDAFTSGQVATKIIAFGRSATDSSTYTDAATRIGTFLRSSTDTSAFVDAATRGISRLRSVSDAFTSGQVATQIRALARNAVDVFTSSDLATKARSVFAAATDSQTFADAAIAIKNLVTTFVRAGQITGGVLRILRASGIIRSNQAGGTTRVKKTE